MWRLDELVPWTTAQQEQVATFIGEASEPVTSLEIAALTSTGNGQVKQQLKCLVETCPDVWAPLQAKVIHKNTLWDPAAERTLIRKLISHGVDIDEITKAFPNLSKRQIYGKIAKMLEKSKDLLASHLGEGVRTVTNVRELESYLAQLSEQQRMQAQYMAAMDEKLTYMDNLLVAKGPRMVMEDAQGKMNTLYNEKIKLMRDLWEGTKKGTSGTSHSDSSSTQSHTTPCEQVCSSSASTITTEPIVTYGEPQPYLCVTGYEPENQRDFILPQLLEYFRSNGLPQYLTEEFPIVATSIAQSDVDWWEVQKQTPIINFGGNHKFLVESRMFCGYPFLMRLRSCFPTWNVAPALNLGAPGLVKCICYCEIRIDVPCGHIALGAWCGKDVQGPLQHFDSCWLSSDGRLWGGSGKGVYIPPMTSTAEWPVTDTRFGPQWRRGELIGIGYDRTKGQIFFTRFVKGNMVKFVIENFPTHQRHVRPAILLSGYGTFISIDLSADPKNTIRAYRSPVQAPRQTITATTSAHIPTISTNTRTPVCATENRPHVKISELSQTLAPITHLSEHSQSNSGLVVPPHMRQHLLTASSPATPSSEGNAKSHSDLVRSTSATRQCSAVPSTLSSGPLPPLSESLGLLLASSPPDPKQNLAQGSPVTAVSIRAKRSHEPIPISPAKTTANGSTPKKAPRRKKAKRALPETPQAWLASFEMESAWETLRQNGFNSLLSLAYMTDSYLTNIGFTIPGQRAVLVGKAAELKEMLDNQ